jgi:hypothetical protein
MEALLMKIGQGLFILFLVALIGAAGIVVYRMNKK